MSDVWDAELVDDSLVHSSAAKVIEKHMQDSKNDIVMPNCSPMPSKNSKVQAMQRLATQRGKTISARAPKKLKLTTNIPYFNLRRILGLGR